MNYAAGTLVRARGRDWVVLPDSDDRGLRLKPLGGADLETTSILPSLEEVAPATFALPDPDRPGPTASARLLRDAVRLGFRASAGPFRSLGSIAVEPRPYQLVPLLMALRLQTVRLLIADDTGIGKTVEASLIARELLARGEVDRLCVLCPPHLAEQWEAELRTKFNLDPRLVLPGTVAKLERECMPGESLFERFPVTVVSLDYIKQQRRRDDFARTCPPLIIVDEAHGSAPGGRSGQLRFDLLKRLSADPKRHILLVTAIPHSGKSESFQALLSLLRPEFADLPQDLSGEQNRPQREQLARHFVQRRRGDILSFCGEETPFPERLASERTYHLHPEYKAFLQRIVSYARELVGDKSGTQFQQRIRWWSALALLRSVSSSPAAAAATLRARARNADAEDVREIDRRGTAAVFDLDDEADSEGDDVTPGVDLDDGDSPARDRLRRLAKQADALAGATDRKLSMLVETAQGLLDDGYSPILFCRYIPTAEYLAERLGKALKGVEVACVTGTLPHDERESRVLELAEREKRVLVCTDCLSEGINLQETFDAVVHADLAWSPTRHEQREGRVDRFLQRSPKVRIVTCYGQDNPIDGIVLQTLIRKHDAIRKALGISVPVPVDQSRIGDAIVEGLLLRNLQDPSQLNFLDLLDLGDGTSIEREWNNAAEREKRSRTLFAQHAIKVDEVEPELREVRRALGSPLDLHRFVRGAVVAHGGHMEDARSFTVRLEEAPIALRDAVRYSKPFRAGFASPPPQGAELLTRTHPFVEGLATHVMDTALSGEANAVAARCGCTVTDQVAIRTTVLLLRCRYQLRTGRRDMLAEEAFTVAFRGRGDRREWLGEEEVEALLAAPPAGNLGADGVRQFLRSAVVSCAELKPELMRLATDRADRALQSHTRVRAALEGAPTARSVRVQGEPDVLGIYVMLPGGDR